MVMTNIEASVDIAAPIEEVFAFASDWKHWEDWWEGVSDFRPTTQVTQGNGARYAYKARMMGVSASVETEIHEFVPNRGWKGVSTKGIPHRTHCIFEQVGDCTKFTYALEYDLRVPLLGSMLDSLFMKPQWNRIIRESLDNLKQHFLTQAGLNPKPASDESG